MSRNQDADVFVSYASHDAKRVTEIVQQLEAAGVRCWCDQQKILGGSNYGLEIVQGIRQAKLLLLMCTDASLRSKNIKQEIQLAWNYNVPYLPVLLESISYPEQVKYWLEGWQWVKILNHPAETWLPAILMTMSQIGIECELERTYTSQSSINGWFDKMKRLLLDRKSQPTPIIPTSNVKAILSKQGIEGLRNLAKFTDQIWPIPANKSPGYHRSLRDLGALQDNVQHSFHLGSQVRLVIESDQEGYLLLLDEGTSGKIYCLCPSQFAPEMKIQTGRSYLPQAESSYEAFPITGEIGRENLLAIISDQPLMLDWMPIESKIPTRELNPQDIPDLLGKLHELGNDKWTVLSTYFDVI